MGGAGTVATSGRQAFWANTFAKDILDVARLTHMQASVSKWNEFYAQGRLGGDGEPIAILVDGSVERPVPHVKVFGQIAFVESPRDNLKVIEAVADVLKTWSAAAPRGDSGDYLSNLYVFMDNHTIVDADMFNSDRGKEYLSEISSRANTPPFFTVINTMPYAAKVERDRLPHGVGYLAWKVARGKWGNELALRFRYYTAEQIDIANHQLSSFGYKEVTKTTGGGPRARTTAPAGATRRQIRDAARDRERYRADRPLSFPAVNIGPIGAFNSGASKIIIKAAVRKR